MTLVAVAIDPAPSPPLDPLVRRARDGDAEAFAQLYHQHVAAVHARLTRLIGPVPEREDLLQQTFLRAHRALPRFRGDASFATFLYAIAVNLALDHLRTQRRRPLALDDDAVAAAVGAADPAGQVADREVLARVGALLDELTAEQRVAFVLIAIEGLSAREAGALVGASPDAVKQRAIAARRALVARLARPRRTP